MHRYALASASLAMVAFATPAMANEDVLQQIGKARAMGAADR